MVSRASSITEFLDEARRFKIRLDQVKAALPDRTFAWYPYDSLANFVHFDRLLTGASRDFASLLGTDSALDVGCADGDLSYFLESMGFDVTAIDHPVTSHNGMEGVKALKKLLDSKVRILSADLDSQFSLNNERYGAAFLLGALYHLKNPFYVLETLARHAQVMFLSTRVAQRLPDKTDIRRMPVAYLLDDQELNADNSNFWIFSELALRRMLERCRWDVVDYLSVGDAASDPIRRDERAFVLARSRFGLKNVELLEGWHDLEGNGWRWTKRIFGVRCGPPHPRGGVLRLSFYLHDMLIDRWKAVRLIAKAGEQVLASETYAESGDQTFRFRLPSESLIDIHFELDHAIAPEDLDGRELGIIAADIDIS